MIIGYEILLLDAANTIIHKPRIWQGFIKVLSKYRYDVKECDLRTKHKMISEIIHFPDRTDAEFYMYFNRELLLAMGIVPTDDLLEDIFAACTYLPWERFDDTDALNDLNIDLAILSNFKRTLDEELVKQFGDIFEYIITSESVGLSKPDPKFYQHILDVTNVPAERILYVGDSLKLDIIPAQSVGITSILIDRDGNFPYYENRITSLYEINRYFE